MKAMFGYQKIAKEIRDNFLQNQLHHALLLQGRQGIGKASFANQLALSIISGFVDSERPAEFAKHSDILVIRREQGAENILKKDITVDSIRKINDFANLTSAYSKYRAIIIDSIDELNRNSSNALLKILEEPPNNIFFLLINHNYTRLPATVKSRCNVIKIDSLDYENWAKAVLLTLPQIEKEELAKFFYISQGSVGLALELYHHKALDLYQNIVKTTIDNVALSSLADKVAQKTFSWQLFEQLINLFLNRLIKVVLGAKLEIVIFLEEEIMLKNWGIKSPSAILKVYEQANALLSATHRLNLDKKQSAINIFLQIKAALR